VAVVIKTVAEEAGSLPNFFIARGIIVPKKPAIIKLTTIAAPTTKPSKGVLLKNIATAATIIPL